MAWGMIAIRIGIIGGTGMFGRGLTLRWAQDHKIIIGSRTQRNAERARDDCLRILGEHDAEGYVVAADNIGAVVDSDAVVIAIHYPHVHETLKTIAEYLDGHMVVSPVIPLLRAPGYTDPVQPTGNSASAEIAGIVPDDCNVVAALHTLPASRLAELDSGVDVDVPVYGNDVYSRRVVIQLIGEIPEARAVDAGPLSESGAVEEQAAEMLSTVN